MASSRPLIIPQKRSLLPPHTNTRSAHKPIPKVLNPSAIPAETRMKQRDQHTADKEEETEADKNTTRTEFSLVMVPQPFLDPPTWEAMLKRRAQAARTESSGEGANATERDGRSDDSGEFETSEQRRRRRETEAGYGSMAIRGRSSVSGRGLSGRRFWGGQH